MKLKNIGSIAPTKSITGILLVAMLVVVLWLVAGGTQQAGAVPANDNFASATVIASVPFTTTQNNAGATTETGEPLPCGAKGATAWFRFTPTVDMNVTVDTNGSLYDTVLAVYTGSVLNNLTEIDCNDNFSGLQSQVSFLGRAGVTYQIQAGGNTGAAGSLTLNVNGVAKGGIPSLINYQGLLTDPGTGNPVADGGYFITFRIFDDATGGSQLWSETQKVAVSDGLFNVLLGSSTSLTAGIFSGTTRFLEVQVTGDPAMTPRQRLATVPYAFQADLAESLQGPGGFSVKELPNGWRFEHPSGLPMAWLETGKGGTDGWLSINGILLEMNRNGPDMDQALVMFDDGIRMNEELRWSDINDRFQFSNDLFVNGAIFGASFNSTSDRNAKANFEAVDGRELLDRLASVPIESWTFKDDQSGARHIGPTAQDFSAAFGVGADDTSINLTDSNGVALVAIQGLYEELQAEKARNDSLEARLTALENGASGSPQAATASSGEGGSWLPIVLPLLALFAIPVAGLFGGWAGRRARS